MQVKVCTISLFGQTRCIQGSSRNVQGTIDQRSIDQMQNIWTSKYLVNIA